VSTVPTDPNPLELGAVPSRDGRVGFSVWAPAAREVSVRLGGSDHALAPAGDGFHAANLAAAAGADYLLVLDGEAYPDPCSRFQPQGIDGPSRVVDPGAFTWTDDGWSGIALDDLAVYELHIGTFSESGTFDGVVPYLEGLRDLGITAIEVMPIATFPGERNWGYDGVYASAPHPVYGGPHGFARLVDAAHATGLGVILDVVYNHVGPGHSLRAFGPYFDETRSTFWGDAIDYGRRGVREWAIQNAELWIRDYHVDGLRLDATHAIFDDSVPHVLAELATRVRAIDPGAVVISEMRTGDLRPIAEWGHDVQWADEFHHVLHVLLTGERDGYYAGYEPSVGDLAAQVVRGPARRFVYCSQNHDQVGNRALGDRPTPDQLRIRAAALLLAPQVPLLFMGEEYGEQRPFRFFTDHTDPAIAEATREGRRREFERFAAFAGEEIPDPQDAETFEISKLDRTHADHELSAFYRELLALRRTLPKDVAAEADDGAALLHMKRGDVDAQLRFSEPRLVDLRRL
jgi:maltooligosyltrehalose trehalohydrolase